MAFPNTARTYKVTIAVVTLQLIVVACLFPPRLTLMPGGTGEGYVVFAGWHTPGLDAVSMQLLLVLIGVFLFIGAVAAFPGAYLGSAVSLRNMREREKSQVDDGDPVCWWIPLFLLVFPIILEISVLISLLIFKNSHFTFYFGFVDIIIQ
jgi:hypothetical protein